MAPPGLFELQSHGADTFVGHGPEYPWGGLYGGQIVAQALRAAAQTVEPQFITHSLRAYFIRRGDHREPVRYEVDRIRNGRSFVTRRVVARQAVGAILNLEASFQTDEPSAAVQTVAMPDVPGPEELVQDSWLDRFVRRDVPASAFDDGAHIGSGRVVRWVKLNARLGDLDDPNAALDHLCWTAFMSDDVPSDAVIRSHPSGGTDDHEQFYGASLDHTMWFHRPFRVDEWLRFEQDSPVSDHSRGFARCAFHTREGVRVASCNRGA